MNIEVEDIFYDYNRATLRPESKVALDKLVEILEDNENIAIELLAHTDFRGTHERNDTLSQGRAQSVVNYLIENGIDRNRLVATGYGERRPRVTNQKIHDKYNFLKVGDELSEIYITDTLRTDADREVAHQINRRTELKILSNDWKPGMILKATGVAPKEENTKREIEKKEDDGGN